MGTVEQVTGGAVEERKYPVFEDPGDLGFLQSSKLIEFDKVRKALHALDPDCPRDQWLTIGQALWSFSPHLQAEWDAWSQLSDKYVSGEPALLWRSFSELHRVNVGILFQLADATGSDWYRDPSLARRRRVGKRGQAPQTGPGKWGQAPRTEPVPVFAASRDEDGAEPEMNHSVYMSEPFCVRSGAENALASDSSRNASTSPSADASCLANSLSENQVRGDDDAVCPLTDHSVDSVYSVYASGWWSPPVPFSPTDVPTFPVKTIAEPFRSFVKQTAEFTQTPVDLAAGMFLAVAAISLQGKFVVQVRRGWLEPLNIYLMSILDSANRKSAVMSLMASPLQKFETEESKRLGPLIRAANSRHDIASKLRSRCLQRSSRTSGVQCDELLKQVKQLDDQMAADPIPAVPRWLAEDITPECLATRMSQNEGRMGILTCEGDLFDIMTGRYSKGAANLGIFLKSHSGDEVRVDRGNRPSELIRRPTLTLGCAVQPNVLRGLLRSKCLRERGLLGRILYQVPPSLVGRRMINPPEIDPLVQARYERGVGNLLRLPFPPRRVEDDPCASGFPILNPSCNAIDYPPAVLTLSSEAADELTIFMKEVEESLGEFGELAPISDWGGKLVGAVARIAGLLHCTKPPQAVCLGLPPHERQELFESAHSQVPHETPQAVGLGLPPHERQELFESAHSQVPHEPPQAVGLGLPPHERQELFESAHSQVPHEPPQAVGLGLPPQLDRGTMQDAISIGRYLQAHAIKAFSMMGFDETVAMAEHLLKVIAANRWKRFSKRDLHQHVRRRVRTPDELDVPLKRLVEHGYLRRVDFKKLPSGRTPSPRFLVNPELPGRQFEC